MSHGESIIPPGRERPGLDEQLAEVAGRGAGADLELGRDVAEALGGDAVLDVLLVGAVSATECLGGLALLRVGLGLGLHPVVSCVTQPLLLLAVLNSLLTSL